MIYIPIIILKISRLKDILWDWLTRHFCDPKVFACYSIPKNISCINSLSYDMTCTFMHLMHHRRVVFLFVCEYNWIIHQGTKSTKLYGFSRHVQLCSQFFIWVERMSVTLLSSNLRQPWSPKSSVTGLSDKATVFIFPVHLFACEFWWYWSIRLGN